MRSHKTYHKTYLLIGARRLMVLGALLLGMFLIYTSGAPAQVTAEQPSYKVTDLGTLPGGNWSAASDINEKGQVVGTADDHAFLYENGQMKSLGTLPGGNRSQANGINDSGQVVGVSTTSSGQRAFLYENSQMVDLGAFPGGDWSVAYDINDKGQVVGVATAVGTDHGYQAFLYENRQMTDLNNLIPQDSGWILLEAMGINDKGQIVGSGLNAEGQVRAVLLEPVVQTGPSYEFKGFFQPVDNLPTANKVKAGSAIPVKFSLGGYQGDAIFEKDFPRSQQIESLDVTAADPIEQTVTAGQSSLSYDQSTDQYTYVWKTDKSWANQYRQLVIVFNDGQTYRYRANFWFTK